MIPGATSLVPILQPLLTTANEGYVFGDTASYSGLTVSGAQSVNASVSNNELTLVLTFAVTGS